jgi:hypothetical protein
VEQTGVVAGGGVLTDWISLGVLASSVPRDAVDDAVAVTGRGARAGRGEAAAACDGVLRDGAGVVRR